MKKIFKLAAIAVSMALVTSLVACSSGDDDVVDTTTSKYLLEEQIGKYVDSIEYDQNVSDDEIKSLKTAHEDVMKLIGNCEDCLAYYFEDELKYCDAEYSTSYWTDDDGEKHSYTYRSGRESINSTKVKTNKEDLECLKSCYAKEEDYHKMYVYRLAINKALDAVDSAWKVYNIGATTVANENSILKGELNERQAANMKAYTDAAAALKAALSDDDKKTCKTTIDAADKAIKAFDKSVENKTVSKTVIKDVTDAVWQMCDDIRTNVCDTIYSKYQKLESDYKASLKK